MSTIHEAVEIPTGKKDRFDQQIMKPEAVHEYTKNIKGCDLADQLINSYCMLRRTCKWWRKIFFHFFAACINNAYIIYKKYVRNPMSHDRFMEILAEKLIESSKDSCTIKVSRPRSQVVLDDSIHLEGRHFPSCIGKESTKSGSKLCKVCNFGKKTIKEKGFDGITISRKLTSYMCKKCKVPLCIEPCFELYYTKEKYRDDGFQHRISHL